jgi:hypothetical protein
MSLTNMIASADASLATTQWAFRNRIINGNCNIAQRSSFLAAPGTSGYGGPDRYLAMNSGAADGEFTQSQGTITYNGVMLNAVVQTVNTAIVSTTTTNYWSGIDQRIEGYNAYDLLGKPVAVSFIFNTNVTGTYSFALRDGTGANSYVNTCMAVANVPQKVVIPLPMLPLTLAIPNSTSSGLEVNVGFLNTGTYQTSVLNVWQTGDYAAATGATNWGMTIGNFIAMTGLQLEVGAVATSFENRPIGTELALCQRYFETGYWILDSWSNAAGDWTVGPVDFKATKRVAPTITYTTATNAYLTGLQFQPYVDRLVILGYSTQATVDFYATGTYTAGAEL